MGQRFYPVPAVVLLLPLLPTAILALLLEKAIQARVVVQQKRRLASTRQGYPPSNQEYQGQPRSRVIAIAFIVVLLVALIGGEIPGFAHAVTLWHDQTSGTSSTLNDVVWSGSQFVAVGGSGVLSYFP